MRRSEMHRRFDEIVDFAEVEPFLDTPVKRYSSGMSVRLGFAVAAHLEPEILIVDEVLAVGDAAFQKKCLAKMGDVSGEGRTILFVSHNMPAVEALCSQAVALDHGQVVDDGPARQVVRRYLDRMRTRAAVDVRTRTDRKGDGRMRFHSISSDLRTGTDSEVRLAYTANLDRGAATVSFAMFDYLGAGVAYFASHLTGEDLLVTRGDGTIVCRIPRLPVLPGRYSVNIYGEVNGVLSDWVIDAAELEVGEGDYFGTGKLPPSDYGRVALQQTWHAESGRE